MSIKSILPQDSIVDVTLKLVNGLCKQLFNVPIDMVVEKRLHSNYLAIRPSQFVSLHATHQEYLSVLTTPDIKKLTPPLIFKASSSMNCAYALFIDSLYAGKTDYASAYKSFDVFPLGKRLFDLWEASKGTMGPGDEYILVDQFAGILKLQGWFEWRPDNPEPNRSNFEPSAESPQDKPTQGPTNPELLKAKEPATVMYLLSALERFEGMSREQILQIASDVAIRGMEGIDYASSDRQYTIKAFPGETFSGLQMMCLMYVGFRKVEPSLNTGLDFSDAYEMALTLYKPTER